MMKSMNKIITEGGNWWLKSQGKRGRGVMHIEYIKWLTLMLRNLGAIGCVVWSLNQTCIFLLAQTKVSWFLVYAKEQRSGALCWKHGSLFHTLHWQKSIKHSTF